MNTALTATILTQDYCRYLAARLRATDRKECAVLNGQSPYEALLYGMDGDYARCVWGLVVGVPCPVGAFGYDADTVWSLWTDDLTLSMKKQILREAPKLISDMVKRAGCPLSNWTLDGNHQVRKWLHHTGAFEIAMKPVLLGTEKVSMRWFRTKETR